MIMKLCIIKIGAFSYAKKTHRRRSAALPSHADSILVFHFIIDGKMHVSLAFKA